jgi:hypothetical protein
MTLTEDAEQKWSCANCGHLSPGDWKSCEQCRMPRGTVVQWVRVARVQLTWGDAFDITIKLTVAALVVGAVLGGLYMIYLHMSADPYNSGFM